MNKLKNAPNIKIPSTNGETFELKKIKNKFLVLYFYPKDDTPGCTIETKDFNKLLSKFKNLDCAVFGISKDDMKSHDKFKQKYKVKFDLLSDEKKEAFMKEIGLYKTGLNQLIKEGYDLLKLDTFFTSGPEESRAWTVRKNTIAPKAASVIHTDFEKNFIRAEAVSCEDFIKYGSAEKCKENGKLRIEGKDYIVKDGDVLYFRVNP